MDENEEKQRKELCLAQCHLIKGDYTILCDREETTKSIISIIKALENGYQLIRLEQFIDAINELAEIRVHSNGNNEDYLKALEDVAQELRKAI